MRSDVLSLQLRTRYISGLVTNIQTYFERETGVAYPADAVEDALQIWLESRFDRMIEGLGEVITSPHMAESLEFRRILEGQLSTAAAETVQTEPAAVAEETSGTIFNGHRPYAPERLGAMIEYIARSGRNIYKTNLNKLLFYADMTFYYLHDRGISGATYVNMPYGPVPDGVNDVLDELAASGNIIKGSVQGLGTNAQLIKPGLAGARSQDILTSDEIATLEWVLGQYGDLSPSEITELSHSEKAYASTRPNEHIAYEYAKFFAKLPD